MPSVWTTRHLAFVDMGGHGYATVRLTSSGPTAQEKARAAYLAICLDVAPGIKERHRDQWSRAIQALASYPRVMQVMFYESPFPAGDAIRRKAPAAGLETPAQIKWWV